MLMRNIGTRKSTNHFKSIIWTWDVSRNLVLSKTLDIWNVFYIQIVFGKRGQRLGMYLKFNFCRSKFKVLLHASVVLSGWASIIEGEIKEILIVINSKLIFVPSQSTLCNCVGFAFARRSKNTWPPELKICISNKMNWTDVLDHNLHLFAWAEKV